ncbi:MAG: chromosomal replication initiator protein [Gaiellales bacterium]|nr:chromosomal replication initiator protein [Gaiellales bacterium]
MTEGNVPSSTTLAGVTEQSAADLWADVSGRLRADLPVGVFAAWFGAARPVGLEGDDLEIGVPNEFTRAWIEGHFSDLVSQAAAESRERLGVRFAVLGDGGEPVELPASEPAIRVTSEPRRPERLAPSDGGTAFLPKYTFDSFVIGSSNRFSHAAALAVAEAPGQAYNPLLIHGGTGLGKTHLLQAIGQYVRAQHPDLVPRYVTSETFTNEFIEALRDKRLDQFKQRYRARYDVLLVDDVQFLGGKERIQEEFFHTFNTLYEAGKQVVLTCDRPVREMGGLEQRLRSRFEWGLTTDVQPPDLETRLAILSKHVDAHRVPIADGDVLDAIARRVVANIRELEGALTRVIAYASLTGRPITAELVRETLHDLSGDPRAVTVADIQVVVGEAFGVSVADIRSARRSQHYVRPRQIAMYLARELTDQSLPRIGDSFCRDHTTVLYAVRRVTERIREDRLEYNLVQDLIARIRQQP